SGRGHRAAWRPGDREEAGCRGGDLARHEEMRLVEAGPDARPPVSERLVHERQRALVRPHVPTARHPVAEAEHVELEDLLASCAPGGEVGLELLRPLESPHLYV